jgi:hypothetical protein
MEKEKFSQGIIAITDERHKLPPNVVFKQDDNKEVSSGICRTGLGKWLDD